MASQLQRGLDEQHKTADAGRRQIETALDTRTRIVKIARCIEEAEKASRMLTAQLKELKAHEERLASDRARPPDHTVIRLPANSATAYRRAIDRFGTTVLARPAPSWQSGPAAGRDGSGAHRPQP